jgi:N-acetyl-gamma-glutamylphosphate reductase
VAGATGYTGQELLRLLARHPSVTITAATSSGATPAGGARRLPALSRIWNGTITPLKTCTFYERTEHTRKETTHDDSRKQVSTS